MRLVHLYDGTSLTCSFTPQALPGEPISLAIAVTAERGWSPTPNAYWDDMARLLRVPLVVFFAMLRVGITVLLVRRTTSRGIAQQADRV